MVDLSAANPLANFHIGGIASTLANVGIVLVISIIIIALIGVLVYIKVINKQYWIKIHLFKLVGNTPTRVGIFCAKDVPFGRAGDKLWRVAPNGFYKGFKIIKWLSIGKYQTANNEFWYWLREDGEWINFKQKNIDAETKSMNIEFVQEDMRLQRLATEKLLEQRLMNKSFWDKWGNLIMSMVFFLVLAVCMVIIFYQWDKIAEKTAGLLGSITQITDKLSCTANSGLIPVK